MENEAEGKIEYVNEGEESAEQKIKKLRGFLKHCKKRRAEYLEGWQRSRAEFQNYLKQAEREKDEFRKFATDTFVLKLLPVLDALVLACGALPEKFKDDSWAKGILAIRKQLEALLLDAGIEEVPSEVGSKFDLHAHEAVEQVASELERGTILWVAQKGYTLHKKLIRPARVRIAN
jgi:molecular chaperone GrpE